MDTPSPHANSGTTMSKIDIHVNPHPQILPPPWYRPPPEVTKGPKRRRNFIIFGLLIDYEVGREWFQKTYQCKFRSDHRQDMSVYMQLDKLVTEKGIALGSCAAPRRLESHLNDFLVVTQIEHGPFIHDGPQMYEEVLEEDRRPIPGVKRRRG